MSAGNYLLVKFDDRSKLTHAAEAIDEIKAVSRWEAVEGYYSMVVQTNDDAAADAIEKLDGCTELARCQTISNGTQREIDPEHVGCYLFAEIDESRIDEVCKTLSANQRVVSCVSCRGDYQLVAVVAGENFDSVDRVIEREIRQLDGILRMKQGRIIYLDRM